MFHVGQKVVCIDADGPTFEGVPHVHWRPSEKIVNGTIYTVRKVYVDSRGAPCLWLNEVQRSPESQSRFGPTVGYGQHRFRPLAERKTDISIFTAMLTPNRVKELVAITSQQRAEK